MGSEPKKLALLRILDILQTYSDPDHPLKQEEIRGMLMSMYGIEVERKAVGRNLALLKEAGVDVVSGKQGNFIVAREFDDSELHMLIDAVLASRYIAPGHSAELIEKLCNLSNVYFRSHVKNIYTVEEWGKTDNKALFYNISVVDEAVERGVRIGFTYNKYGTNGRLHPSSEHTVSPYQLFLHNQRYYLMSYSERWKGIGYLRLDRMTDMRILEEPALPLTSVEGYEEGINYSEMALSMPYLYAGKLEEVSFFADPSIVDQIVDWFGGNVRFKRENGRIKATVRSTLKAMEYWAMQYLNFVEVISPDSLRDVLRENVLRAAEKYGGRA